MIELRPFDPKRDTPEEWLVKLSKFLNENYWLELLLSGKLVPKSQKTTFATSIDIEGDATIGGKIYLENQSAETVGGTIYADATILKVLMQTIAGSKFIVYDSSGAAALTITATATTAAGALSGTTVTGTNSGIALTTAGNDPVIDVTPANLNFQIRNLATSGRNYYYADVGHHFVFGNTKTIVFDNTPRITLADTTDTSYIAGTLQRVGSALKWYNDTIETQNNKNAASGYAGLDGSSKLTGSQQVYGTTSNTACQGNDDRLAAYYGEMYSYENASATTINTVNVYHALQGVGLGAGTNSGFTFTAGITGTIASVANYGGTVAGTVLMTDVAHGLTTGDIITIHSSTDYDGTFSITKVSDDTFYVTATWTVDRTGTWHRGARLVPSVTGVYRCAMSNTSWAAVANKTFRFEVYVNATAADNIAVSRKFSSTDYGSLSASGLLSLTAGDHVWIAVRNETDGTDVTVRHSNLSLVRV